MTFKGKVLLGLCSTVFITGDVLALRGRIQQRVQQVQQRPVIQQIQQAPQVRALQASAEAELKRIQAKPFSIRNKLTTPIDVDVYLGGPLSEKSPDTKDGKLIASQQLNREADFRIPQEFANNQTYLVKITPPNKKSIAYYIRRHGLVMSDIPLEVQEKARTVVIMPARPIVGLFSWPVFRMPEWATASEKKAALSSRISEAETIMRNQKERLSADNAKRLQDAIERAKRTRNESMSVPDLQRATNDLLETIKITVRSIPVSIGRPPAGSLESRPQVDPKPVSIGQPTAGTPETRTQVDPSPSIGSPTGGIVERRPTAVDPKPVSIDQPTAGSLKSKGQTTPVAPVSYY